MLTVTAKAKEKLNKEALEKQTMDPEAAIRIIPSSSMPTRLEFVLDKEREGDQVVEREESIGKGKNKSPMFPISKTGEV